MKLYIDTTNAEQLTLQVGEEKITTEARKEKSQLLLTLIDELLKKQNKTVNDLTTIDVNTGSGSFTGIRVGVSVAQALAWSLDIPLNGKKISQGQSLSLKYT